MQGEYQIKMNIDDEIDKVIDNYIALTRANHFSENESRENLDEFTEEFSKRYIQLFFLFLRKLRISSFYMISGVTS